MGTDAAAEQRAAGDGAAAAHAWANASPLGLLAIGVILCSISAVRLACAFVFLQASSAIRGRTSFAVDGSENEAKGGLSKPLRWCVCESSFDPIGRMGKKGTMLTDDFCDACYSAAEMVDYRRRLLRNGSNFPWLLCILSALLVLLAFAPLARRCPSLHQKVYSLTGVMSLIDLIINVGVLISWSNSEVFKQLCFQGHAFDTTYKTEVAFPDSTYGDACAYSAREHNMSKAILGIVVLDVFVFAAFAYMQTLREQGALNLLSKERRKMLYSLAARALPVSAFDIRRGVDATTTTATPAPRGRFENRQRSTLGVDISLGLGAGRRARASLDAASGLLSGRRPGQGRRKRSGLRAEEALQEVREDIHLQFDAFDSSDNDEGISGGARTEVVGSDVLAVARSQGQKRRSRHGRAEREATSDSDVASISVLQEGLAPLDPFRLQMFFDDDDDIETPEPSVLGHRQDPLEPPPLRPLPAALPAVPCADSVGGPSDGSSDAARGAPLDPLGLELRFQGDGERQVPSPMGRNLPPAPSGLVLPNGQVLPTSLPAPPVLLGPAS